MQAFCVRGVYKGVFSRFRDGCRVLGLRACELVGTNWLGLRLIEAESALLSRFVVPLLVESPTSRNDT